MLTFADYIILFFLGSIGAFIAGLLGVGGGIVYIPILDFFLSKLGLQQGDLVKGILANSLFVIIFSGAVSSFKQYQLKNFFPREILFTAIPGTLSAVLMTFLIKNGTWYSKESFTYVFASMLLIIIIRMFLSKSSQKQSSQEITSGVPYSITGFFAGFVTALSGLGGGVIMTPIFTDVLKVEIKKASSISNGVIPFFAIAIGIMNLSAQAPVFIESGQIGYILLPLVAPMILATFVFAPIGVKYAQTSKPQTIRIIFAIFVSLVFLKLMYEIIR